MVTCPTALPNSDGIPKIKSQMGSDRLVIQFRYKYFQEVMRVENTPKREQELMSLQRDYTNIQESYSSLLRRKLESEIAVNMEKKQQGERFRIIDYARLPEKPASPDMIKLFLIVTAAGLGLGCGIVYLLEFMDTSFRRSADIAAYLGISVIAEVPSIKFPEDLKRYRIQMSATILCIFISCVLLISFFAVTLIGAEKIKNIVSLSLQSL